MPRTGQRTRDKSDQVDEVVDDTMNGVDGTSHRIANIGERTLRTIRVEQ